MRSGSSIGRLLACLAVVLVLGGGIAGVATATSGADGSGPTIAAIDDRTEGVEDGPSGTTGLLENVTDETTDVVENTTDETTDAVEDTTDETTDTVENTTGETTDTVENTTDETTDTVEHVTDETTDGLDDAVENATDEVAIERVVSDTTSLVDDAVTGTTTLTSDLTDETLAAEPSASPESEPGDADEDDGTADATDEWAGSETSDDDAAVTDGPTSEGTSAAVDAIMVGLLGAMTATGAAAGGAGAGAGGAHATSTTASALRRLRRAWSALPWEVVPIFRYSRYDDSDPLENDRRRAVYETIEADPGCYLSRIGERSGVSLSTVRHHVRILEEEGLVRTAKVNGKRRYYVEDGTSPTGRDDAALALHAALDEPARREVLETLADLGRAQNGRLAEALDRDPSTVSHHLSSLAEDDLVVRERDGRAIVNELAPTVEAALDEEDAAAVDASSPTAADD